MSLEFAGTPSPPFPHGPKLLNFRSIPLARVTALRIACAHLVVALVAGCGGRAAPPIAPPEVKDIPAAHRDVPIISEWVATLDAYVNPQIQPQLAAYIVKQTYNQGPPVRRCDILS